MTRTVNRIACIKIAPSGISYFLISTLIVLFNFPTHLFADENSLKDATSPYLLQHADNPVDWYQWNAETLEKAHQQNKPIFVSVGYSSCFWCHVMAEESFEDESIARVLNDHFIAIKIDRETRPDLDERFTHITETLTGTAGWPNSVFLTPSGDPILAGGYFSPSSLMQIARQLGENWIERQEEVVQDAAINAENVNALMSPTIGDQMLFDVDTASSANTILPELDTFDGGLGVAPKFPREPVFLFLLDEALRNADFDMLTGVTDMLDGMLLGGVHDHVGGGFHRYSVDPDWHIPHFEKMLYTQALMGRLLIRTWDVTGEERYRRVAERLFTYVLRDLSAPQGGFYAAQDASSLLLDGTRKEGMYYTWTDGDIAQTGDAAGLLRDAFQISAEGDLDGRNVLNLPAQLSDLAVDADIEESVFVSQIDGALETLRSHRNSAFAPFIDRKIIVSWNAQMIATLAEASFLFDNPAYYEAAATAATFILETMGGPDELLRISIDSSAEEPAQLADYAALGLAAIALHDLAPDLETSAIWLKAAQALMQSMISMFQTENGTFRMSQDAGFIPLNDGILPSGNAMALDFLTQLQSRIEDIQIGIHASSLATALTPSALDSPVARSAYLGALASYWHGDVKRVQYASNGIMRAEIHHDRTANAMSLQVTIVEGWHVNSNKPFQDYLIPITVKVDGVPSDQILYPDPQTKTLGFSQEPLALYEGSFVLHAPLPDTRDGPFDVVFNFQTCSDTICMLPAQLTFVLW